MAVALGGYVLKNAAVTFGGGDYANQFEEAVLTPSTSIKKFRTLVPDGEIVDVDAPSWDLKLSGIQDWIAAQGFARYMNDNRGLVVECVLTPNVGGVSATFDIMCLAQQFGGKQGEFVTIETTLPVSGQPEFTDP